MSGPIGYGSATVNDQLIPVPVMAAFKPLAWGPTYTGPGFWPRQGVYNVPPVMPSPGLQQTMAPQAYGGSYADMGSYSPPSATGENGSPWNLRSSPLIWALLFLAVGLAGLHFIHFR